MRGLSVIVPTYNEAENVPVLIPRIEGAIGYLRSHEIIIVDDSSPDGTAEKSEGLSLRYPVRTLRRKSARSLSGAVIDGARMASFDCIAVLDADLSHEPESLPRIVSPILQGKADITIGSRYLSAGMIEGWPLHRRILSRLGTLLARLIVGVRDPLSGYFACRKDLLASPANDIKPRGYKILLEVLGRIEGLRVEEIPTVFCDRVAGKSKLGLRQQIDFLEQFASLLSFCTARIMRSAFSRVAGFFKPGKTRETSETDR
jgi:dolichol-phosphate mannosyltransferase